MRTKRFSLGLRAAFAIVIVTLLVTTTWAAPREKVLHNFKVNDKIGVIPSSSLIFDAAGNLYGTASAGGNPHMCSWYGCGTVFELMPQAGGGWKEKVLHRFNGKDGEDPEAGLIFDAAGNLYGTTFGGGNLTKCDGWSGCGTVFELMPQAGGGWKEKVLHRFNGKDGELPSAGLIFDAVGNLYGTTYDGGNLTKCGYGCGTVFELMPQAGGGWKEKVLHIFQNGKDGSRPHDGLIFDSVGNLYGTTTDFPDGHYGTVFELMPQAGGGWKEKVLHSFNRKDGHYPYAGLIFDAAGNLYGTTVHGGNSTNCSDCGVVFELMPQASGGWKEKVLHSFSVKWDAHPNAGLIFDANGNLYGTTAPGWGTVFELSPNGGGGWTEKVLHLFGKGKDAVQPDTGLIFDANGNLYGTTSGGGAYGYGTVYEITP